ncbi:MAG: thioredoxin domain-containing protein [Pseudomonadota bacterium]
MANALISETSPYLLQHAHNPVDWHGWNEQSLALARDKNKPILLSVGYAACHWCHVMERESFENAEIARIMNEHFVCIKVDREERPDLDKIYQTAHQMLTEKPGGWPLTMVLTPEHHAPFFAGTYFPPESRFNLPGFSELLVKIHKHFVANADELSAHHSSFHRALSQLNPTLTSDPCPDASDVLSQSAKTLASQFDPTHGGFGQAPKFPHPSQIELLLRHGASGDSEVHRLSLAMAHKTLRHMARGGLFDQIGGGFFRYSVDAAWRIPHFEKMLYDNAQLIPLYADAWLQTEEPLFRRAAEMSADWVIREMQQSNGGFASTLDADSEGIEGKYYVWSETDLRAVLTDQEYTTFEAYYGLYGEPNFEGNWHLNVNPDSEQEWSEEQLAEIHTKLWNIRADRIRPALDNKVLTAWNGMMIRALAYTGRKLGRADYIHAARQSLDFVRNNMWQQRRLFVTYRDSSVRLNGYLDDYAFLIDGVVELLQAEWRTSDLNLAVEITDAMLERFEDAESGGFFFTSNDHEALLYRPKPGADDAIPSGNGVATRALLNLGYLTGDEHYLESAHRVLALYARDLIKHPSVYATLAIALQYAGTNNRTVIVRGEPGSAVSWKSAVDTTYAPTVNAYLIPKSSRNLPAAISAKAAKDRTVAYVCRGQSCSAPINQRDQLQIELGIGMPAS